MDQSNRGSVNLPLDRVVESALGEIERLGYSRRSRNRYRAVWTNLIEYSDQKELGEEFSGTLAARFVEENCAENVNLDQPGQGWRRHIVLGVKVLADFAQHGRIERVRTDTENIHLLPAMKKVLSDYEQYGKNRLQLRPTTL